MTEEAPIRLIQMDIGRALRMVLALSMVATAVIGAGAMADGAFGHLRTRVLLSILAVVVTAVLGSVLLQPPGRRLIATAVAGLVADLLGGTFAWMLIWTEHVTRGFAWRLWWIPSVLALTIAHGFLVLRAPASWLRKATLLAIAPASLLLLSLAARQELLSTPDALFWWPWGVTGGFAVLGSAILLLRHRASISPAARMNLRLTQTLGIPILVFALGFYAGRVTVPPPSFLDGSSSALAGLPPEVIDAHVASDLARLRVLADGVEALQQRAGRLMVEIGERRRAEGRDHYTPAEDDAVKSVFFSYLSYRTALLRMVALYQGFEAVPDGSRKARCFLAGYAAAATVYRASLGLAARFKDDTIVRLKLNEAEPSCGLPPGMFDRIYASVTLDTHAEMFAEMAAYYRHALPGWKERRVLGEEDLAWIEGAIEQGTADVKNLLARVPSSRMELIAARVKRDAYSPVYAVQTVVSEWIGDARLVDRPPMISTRQIREMRAQLQPGDIILERRNWFLSNAFLPGFWPHAALYVGGIDDLRRLGIADEPAVRDRLEEFARPAHDSHPRCVIESISEGVVFSSLEESTGADYIAILRPRVPDAEKARAIVRAFGHQGKPYDFEFDFFSSDKLVCTELVYRAYEGAIHFDLVKIMGRSTLPAVEIARKYAREKDRPERQLEFVLFLDTQPGERQASFREASTFCDSVERPRGFNE